MTTSSPEDQLLDRLHRYDVPAAPVTLAEVRGRTARGVAVGGRASQRLLAVSLVVVAVFVAVGLVWAQRGHSDSQIDVTAPDAIAPVDVPASTTRPGPNAPGPTPPPSSPPDTGVVGTVSPTGKAGTLPDGTCDQTELEQQHRAAVTFLKEAEGSHGFSYSSDAATCTLVIIEAHLTDAQKDQIRALAGGPVRFQAGEPSLY